MGWLLNGCGWEDGMEVEMKSSSSELLLPYAGPTCPCRHTCLHVGRNEKTSSKDSFPLGYPVIITTSSIHIDKRSTNNIGINRNTPTQINPHAISRYTGIQAGSRSGHAVSMVSSPRTAKYSHQQTPAPSLRDRPSYSRSTRATSTRRQ